MMKKLHWDGLNLANELTNQWKFESNIVSMDFNKINIFIGSNNSGKSRLLRLLFSEMASHHLEIIDYTSDRGELTVNKMPNLQESLIDQIIFNRDFYLTPEEIKLVLSKVDSNINYYLEHSEILNKISISYNNVLTNRLSNVDLESTLESQVKTELNKIPKRNILYTHRYNQHISMVIKSVFIENHKRLKFMKFSNLHKPYYIPIQRGMKPILKNGEHVTIFDESPRMRVYTKVEKNCSDYYTRRVIDEYFSHARLFKKHSILKGKLTNTYLSDEFIFTGLSLYNDLKKHLLGNNSKRSRVREYENFLSSNFFNSQSVTLLPMDEKDVVYLSVADEQDRPIYEWGDGIQTIIMVTYLPFMKGEGTFFIEEPDLMLHPGMQRKLIDVLASMDDCQFFLTTHSNHLIDMAIDYKSKVYSFSKTMNKKDSANPIFKVGEVIKSNIQVLRNIGVRHSSSFLVNATIWVEGITDRLYFSRYLEAYHDNHPEKRRYNIDQHYAFVEYGGSNIAHLSYLSEDADDLGINIERLCADAFLILDRDDIDFKRAAELKTDKKLDGKTRRYFLLKKYMGDSVHLLPVRETENLLSPKVIKFTIEDYNLKNSPVLENVLFLYDEYSSEYLGGYIHSKIGESYGVFAELKKTRQKDGTSKDMRSGTISNKLKFCQKALPHISWKSMSNDARVLSKKIYDHIATHNQ